MDGPRANVETHFFFKKKNTGLGSGCLPSTFLPGSYMSLYVRILGFAMPLDRFPNLGLGFERPKDRWTLCVCLGSERGVYELIHFLASTLETHSVIFKCHLVILNIISDP